MPPLMPPGGRRWKVTGALGVMVALLPLAGGCASTPGDPFDHCWVTVENQAEVQLDLLYYPGELLSVADELPVLPPTRMGPLRRRQSRTWREECSTEWASVLGVSSMGMDITNRTPTYLASGRLVPGDTLLLILRRPPNLRAPRSASDGTLG